MAKTTSKAVRLAELAGAPPRMATTDDLAAAGANKHGRQHAHNVTAKQPHRINLKAVAEACMDEGLDPATEITKALNKQIPLFKNGQQVFDDNGLPVMVHLVDSDTRLRTLNELLQYVQPKLKSVEVKMSGSLELSGEQLDQRLASLIAKAVK
jgi:hypothetical protein